ncbi:S41 family peptidase [uncultured Erythrobacter sp.]|uniref:S41 family peptidase n=1 Tax=uncultured Erythrobacter sp. TaxID=263913 RepID=UPI002619955E|nr:S41 family peptidase [uncultured Erythrobacter sp.]
MRAQEQAQEDPKEYLESAFELLESYHINRNEADWAALRDAARALTAQAHSPADTHAALRAVIVALDEKHSYLVPPRKPRKTISAATNAKPPLPPMPEGKRLEGEIGYVAIPSLTTVQGREQVGVQYRDTLQSLLKDLDKNASCGWIIDLRKNFGGNMWPMLNGLDPLLGDGPFGYFVGLEEKSAWVRTFQGISASTANAKSEPSPSFKLQNSSRPIAVLIGEQTTSSGEMVAIALIGLTNSKSFGKPSANFTTAVRPFPLSDGAVLGITSSQVAFASGELVKGAIEPDVLVEDEAQEEAAGWLEEQCRTTRA